MMFFLLFYVLLMYILLMAWFFRSARGKY